MDTPGYDPVSVTGLVAGGATVVVLHHRTRLRVRCRPTPSIKVATNTEMYLRMTEDMDINAGRIVDGTATLEQSAGDLRADHRGRLRQRQTVSEELDLGQEEFVPWQLGAVT